MIEEGRITVHRKKAESGQKAVSYTPLVIDTPSPALAEAIYNATGVRLTELPMTPETVSYTHLILFFPKYCAHRRDAPVPSP